MKEETKRRLVNFLYFFVKFLTYLKVSPTLITLSGLFFSLFAGYFYFRGNFFIAGIFLIFIALADTLDGEIARKREKVSKKGAFLDSVIDRLTEFFIFLGIFLYYQKSEVAILPFLTFATSFFVSYARARAEGVGIECKVGIFERPIRMLFLIIGSFILKKYFNYLLIILIIGNLSTFLQRILFSLKKL
ncbi:MAG: CDP-alcohol phosphatidyltransferase family protein [candidate division WOR-3 bacterium]|nr:CDP-alcohol phosphatidyltransferase family protein [candidate division WOR-3 bacterium]MCX7836736.1 CDP-alcohol phosphatidyltransferase family protein [candidate division WOR-3 bacterium]MDW8113371.1 CDP-alcohol phosphatidyltransferase family protein [candidate division WOR-3 bacterium]